MDGGQRRRLGTAVDVKIAKPCEICGRLFTPKRHDSRCCSQKCKWAVKHRAYYAKNKEKVLIAAALYRATHLESVHARDAAYCATHRKEACARTKAWTVANPEKARTQSSLKRARKRGVTVEIVNALDVFERDGWICHLCDKKTLKSKRGTPHSRAPELDHIIPLAAGGEHSYRNVACACHACNMSKRAKPKGQLRLI